MPRSQALRELSCSKVYNTVQLIYRDKQFETHSKDYEFSLLNMREHWRQGLDDIRETLKHPEWLARPSGSTAVVTHDVHRVEDWVDDNASCADRPPHPNPSPARGEGLVPRTSI
jgi:NTE family protein